MAGESDFINWLRGQQDPPTDFVPVPPGDDLAVLDWPAGELLLVGVDQVLDTVHFDSAVHGPRDIGRKAMNRNLSDCAAMACLPAAAVATVAAPRGVGVDYLKQLYLGLRDAADPFDCPVVGGDTGSWDGRLVVTVTILGRSAGIPPATRRGARPGDGIYVTGPLGGSILGRHMTFEPRVALARQVAQPPAGSGRCLVSAMIDLSDGLSRDLARICVESGVGARLDAGAVPVHVDAVELSRRDGRAALEHALHDGEDYELLFTSPDDIPARLATRIGVVLSDGGVWLRSSGREMQRLVPLGWEHGL